MKIKIYGPGCSNCQLVYERAQQALVELNIAAEVIKIENLNDITTAGILQTPGLSFDDTTIFQGKVPTVSTIKNRLEQYLSANPQ